MDNYTIYMHRNKINKKVYIGITKQKCEDRWRHDGLGYQNQIKFFRAILKYGWDNFEHLILFENLSELEASQKERELIILYDSYNNGYNADLGGSTTNHSPETLEKMRQSMLGKKHSQETKDKISAAKEKDKVSVICLETKKIYKSIADASKDTGTDKSSIVKCCKGIMLSAGGLTWRYADPERNAEYKQATETRINKSKKTVLCIETDTIYETVRAAAQATGADESAIVKVCKGKQKTAGKFHWKYAEKGEENND